MRALILYNVAIIERLHGHVLLEVLFGLLPRNNKLCIFSCRTYALAHKAIIVTKYCNWAKLGLSWGLSKGQHIVDLPKAAEMSSKRLVTFK